MSASNKLAALAADPAPFDDNGPKIPIPGAAGAAVFAALKSLSLFPGGASVTIIKERLPHGGYTYLIGYNHNPARPVRS